MLLDLLKEFCNEEINITESTELQYNHFLVTDNLALNKCLHRVNMKYTVP